MSNKPFDKTYVMTRTLEGMRGAIDFSIRRTMFRNSEFENDEAKQRELMDTLAALTTLHRLLNDFEQNNEKLFNESGK